MSNWKLHSGVAAAIMATAAIVAPAEAQVTTSGLRGQVTSDASLPVEGATVTITDTATGFSRSTTTSASGQYAIRNLPISNSYVVEVTSGDYQGQQVEDVALNLGDSTQLNFSLTTDAEARLETIVVSGTAGGIGKVALGPSSTFDAETLSDTPSINRDIKDIVRLDPRVYLDETFADAVQCAGANPRFNSLTVDGLRLNDAFGLNSGGYPTERIPFSYDAIDQVAVELAPFDVEYGSFTACNINAVTKSGTNEFHGGLFYDYTDDSLRGDEAEDVQIDNGNFDEQRYGFNVGGPIIKDKLFFFAAYEKLEGANLFGDNTPTGKGITDADYQEIVDIAQNVYGYEVGDLPTSLATEDEKLLLKLDWNINNDHRAAFTYNYNDGYNNSESDGDPNELPEFNHFYERGAELNSYTGSLYSDWTNNFSTEFRVSYIDLDNRQQPLGGLDQWGQVEVDVPQADGSGTTRVYLGADDSRHANVLSYELWTYKAKADYQVGDHLFTAGFEREEFDVFNLFVQEVKGEWNFDGIEDFRNGDFEQFEYENATGTNNADDGAAAFGYEISTVYFQDEWQATNKLNVVAGLRYDYYSSSDKPALNQAFLDTYGFGNNETLDGKDVLQPRLAFTYDYSDVLSFRGGLGLFSGGNPNVWISNNYSNNGVTLFECENNVFGGSQCVGDVANPTNVNSFTYDDPRGVFFDVPTEFKDAVANAQGEGAVNALDPDFEIPSDWKANFGLTWYLDGMMNGLGDGFTLTSDLLYTKVNEAAIIRNLQLTQADTAPDGRPIYSGAPFDDFLLTNADNKGETFVFSASLNKVHDFGLDWTIAYAYTDATDTNPMTSSVAFSNDKNYTTKDPLNIPTATSDYEIPHRFTVLANYKQDFFADYTTTFSIFGEIAEGSPYSYTFNDNTLFEGFYENNRQLFYVPDGPNDPLVASAPDGLYSYINSDDCLSDQKGQIADRNSCNDDWYSKFDLKITQDLPGFRAKDKSQVFFVLENVGNFINSDWGVRRQQGFPGAVSLVDVEINDAGQYVYSNFAGNDADEGSIVVEPSLWEIRFGVKYQF